MAISLNSFDTLFLHELRDLHSAETQLVNALPEMAKAASHDELKEAFNEHLEQTRTHVNRLEQIFDQIGESPGGKHCEAMEGLVQEGQEIIQQDAEPNVKDAALIAAAQRVEHYEISGYGTARTYAQELGRNDAADLLEQTLSEEKETDKKLNGLAVERINVEAKQQTM